MDGILHRAVQLQTKIGCKYLEKRRQRGKQRNKRLKEEVEKAVRMLKDGKSPGVDNVAAEILKYAGPDIIDTLTIVCEKPGPVENGPKIGQSH